jgi:hypothetical protein
MTLTLEVSPETVQRVERAKSQGANMDTLLCLALENWFTDTETEGPSTPRSLAPLAGKYEGEGWEDLLTEIERNHPQEARSSAEGK